MSDQLSQDLKSLRIAREVNPEARGRTVRIVVVLLVIIGLLAAGWLFLVPYLRSRLFKTEVVGTEIAMVSPSQGSTTLSSTGNVVAQVTAKVGAQVASRITKVYVKEGSTVKAGDPIADLDVAAANTGIASAGSRVVSARARVDTARAQLDEAKVQLDRERALLDRGVGTKAAVDDLTARVRSLTESVRAAETEVRAAQTDVSARRVEASYGRVVAPIDGTIISKPAQVGEVVALTTSPVIAEMADFSSLVVETDVPEASLGKITVPSPAEIRLDAYPDRRYRGETVAIGKKVDKAKASVIVKVKFLDPMEGVLPDMSATVSFLTAPLDPAKMKERSKPVVPKQAVTKRGGRDVVFVIEEGVVREVEVQLGPELGSGYELKAGPPPGTRVVSDPSGKLESGQKVKEKSE